MSAAARPVGKPAARAGRKCFLAKPIRNTVIWSSIFAIILTVSFLYFYLTYATGGPVFMILLLGILIITWSVVGIISSTIGSALWCRLGPFGKFMLIASTPIIIFIYIVIQVWPYLTDILEFLGLG